MNFGTMKQQCATLFVVLFWLVQVIVGWAPITNKKCNAIIRTKNTNNLPSCAVLLSLSSRQNTLQVKLYSSSSSSSSSNNNNNKDDTIPDTITKNNIKLLETDKHKIDASNNYNDEKDFKKQTSAPPPPSKPLPTEANLEREEMRLGSFEAYVLVSVISATSSYATIQEYEAKEPTLSAATAFESWSDIINSFLDISILLTSSMSTLTGMYATIAFSLSVLYGKTALGMGKHYRYQEFLGNTSLIRIRGFQAFCLSMLTFALQVVLVVCDKAPEYTRIPLLILSAAAAIYVSNDWKLILNQASKIFLPDDD